MYGQFYKPRTNTWKTNPAYREILKLDRLLTEANIPHTLDPMMDGWQICYPSRDESIVMDAIEHFGSYGKDEDLLEIMGLLTPEEEKYDSVKGCLTAEDVFQRIKKHYDTEPSKLIEKVYNDVCGTPSTLPHTRTDPELNTHIDEIVSDFRKLVEKAKFYGLDIKLTPTSTDSLELYFHHDYPGIILVDKEELGL